MIAAEAALQRLKEGNKRFLQGEINRDMLASPALRNSPLQDQAPFAIILGCSDSRVPAEIIFGQGLGDLFVIRVAGNVVAPSQIASIEYAAEMFQTRLVVVLGHSNCGAVQATLEQLQRPNENRSRNLSSIVGRIRPSVESLLQEGVSSYPGTVLAAAVEANILASVRQLMHGSEILESLVQSSGLAIMGAQYSLATGEVTFYQ